MNEMNEMLINQAQEIADKAPGRSIQIYGEDELG